MYKQQSYDTPTEEFFQPSETFFGKSEKMTPEQIAKAFFKFSLRRYNFLTARGKQNIVIDDYGKLYNNINDALVHTFENFVIDDNFKEAIKPNADAKEFYSYTDGKNDNINITIKKGWILYGLDSHPEIANIKLKDKLNKNQVNVHVHCKIENKTIINNIKKYMEIEKETAILNFKEITFEKYKEEKPKKNEEEKPNYFLFSYKNGKITNMYIVIPFLEFIKFYNPPKNKTLIDIATNPEIKTILATEYIKSYNIELDNVCEEYKTRFEQTQAKLKTTQDQLEYTKQKLETTQDQLEDTKQKLETKETELKAAQEELETTKAELIKESNLIELMQQKDKANDKNIEKVINVMRDLCEEAKRLLKDNKKKLKNSDNNIVVMTLPIVDAENILAKWNKKKNVEDDETEKEIDNLQREIKAILQKRKKK